jgi:hypothetical protein
MSEAATKLPPDRLDLLTEATEFVRPRLDHTTSINVRVKILWAAVNASRDLAGADIGRDHFLQLATETGLYADLGRHADQTVDHLVRWAVLSRNPFW